MRKLSGSVSLTINNSDRNHLNNILFLASVMWQQLDSTEQSTEYFTVNW